MKCTLFCFLFKGVPESSINGGSNNWSPYHGGIKMGMIRPPVLCYRIVLSEIAKVFTSQIHIKFLEMTGYLSKELHI